MTDIDAMADLIVRTIRTRGRQVDVTAESAIRDAMRALVPATLQRRDAMTTIPEETLAHWERERARQRATDTAPAELVTEEIVGFALKAFHADARRSHGANMESALRAVAPMIAERAVYEERSKSLRCVAEMGHKRDDAVAAEREACAKIVEGYDKYAFVTDQIAAAIRARGETP